MEPSASLSLWSRLMATWHRFHTDKQSVNLLLACVLCMPMTLMMRAQDVKSSSQRPAEVDRVIDHVLKSDYPEVYQGKPYRLRLRGYSFGDINGDGCTEVFLLTDPNYHQSPPILIYQITKDGKIWRLREGLAPGPLVPFNLERMDTHTLGVAIDMNQVKGKTPDAPIRFAKELSKKMNVVYYRGFIHSDTSDRPQGFVDVSDREEFSGVDKCESLQFSQPIGIEVGRIKGIGGNPVLAALVGKEVYIYQFSGISPEGFLEKIMIRLICPTGTQAILRDKDGILAYRVEPGTRDVAITLP